MDVNANNVAPSGSTGYRNLHVSWYTNLDGPQIEVHQK